MNPALVPPSYGKPAFNCPICGAYAYFDWAPLLRCKGNENRGMPLQCAQCYHCKGYIYWLFSPDTESGHQIYPSSPTAPFPSNDMPEDCKQDYLEARDIASRSPRSAAALLRLSIQRLFIHLGESGKNINTDIGELVIKGLPLQIQQALDIVRVTGNNAVHPGEMNLDDDPDMVSSLFDLVNLIIDNRITQPKHIKCMYEALPNGALSAIKKRDESNT